MLFIYRKRQKFGRTLVWQMEEISHICQTLNDQLAFFVLFIIVCTVSLPNFLLPTC